MNEERMAMQIERDLVSGKSSGSTALAVINIAEQTQACVPGCTRQLLQGGRQAEGAQDQVRRSNGLKLGTRGRLSSGSQPESEPFHRRFQDPEHHWLMSSD